MRGSDAAGPVIVDLRTVGRLFRSRLVPGILLALLALIVIGDPGSWPLLALVGFVIAVTWLLLRLIPTVLAVCEHGVVVRRFRGTSVLPWASVHGLRSRLLASRGGRFRQFSIETDLRAFHLPRALGRHDDNARVTRAIAEIEQRAGVKLDVSGSPAPGG